MNYKHLSPEERYQIAALLKSGQTKAQIAACLDRHKSTISREIERNSGVYNYNARQACLLSQQRSQCCRNAAVVPVKVVAKAYALLAVQWSPEQIADKLPVSHETLYQRIYADKKAGGQLYKHLRCHKTQRKRYGGGRERRGRMPDRRPISQRPAWIEQRRQIGHWEGDTVVGSNQEQAVVTLVDRKSGYALLAKVPSKKADVVCAAIVRQMLPIVDKVKTLTFDNGKEFSQHAKIDQQLNSTTYFADAFASWQRGTNENFNGLLRQYIPRKRPMSSVTEEELKMIQDRLNSRPRKRLGFKTPAQIFNRSLKRVALRA
jgi:transposase, IS30 family